MAPTAGTPENLNSSNPSFLVASATRMSLAGVQLTSEVFRTCVAHALTTETEEIMGLLLGDVLYDDHGRAFARLWVAVPQIRTDRRKDRVEASPEQLAQASAAAEQLSEATQRRTRVIGWYHSHPHITVLPSHVDVRTQTMYQGLDEGFIGLIFSVFNQGGDRKAQKVEVTAFQSMQQGWDPSMPAQRGSWDFDSSMAAAIAASMEEAKANAAAGAQWIQKQVPLTIVPPDEKSEPHPSNLIDLCQVLYDEERHAFQLARNDAADLEGRVSPLTAVHQAAEYQQHLARLIELVLAPALASVKAAQQQAQLQQQQLRDLRDSLAVKARQEGHGSLPPPPMHLNPSSGAETIQEQAKAKAEAPHAWQEEYPDASAPPNAAHFRQMQPNGSKPPAAGSVVYAEWLRDAAEDSIADQPTSKRDSRAASYLDEAWDDRPGSRNGSSNAAPGQPSANSMAAERQGFAWPAQTNWDIDSPHRGGNEGAQPTNEKDSRQGPLDAPSLQERASSPGQLGSRVPDAVATWKEAVLRSQQQSARNSPMRGSRTPSPGMQSRRPGVFNSDPFQALLEDDMAALEVLRHRNN